MGKAKKRATRRSQRRSNPKPIAPTSAGLETARPRPTGTVPETIFKYEPLSLQAIQNLKNQSIYFGSRRRDRAPIAGRAAGSPYGPSLPPSQPISAVTVRMDFPQRRANSAMAWVPAASSRWTSCASDWYSVNWLGVNVPRSLRTINSLRRCSAAAVNRLLADRTRVGSSSPSFPFPCGARPSGAPTHPSGRTRQMILGVGDLLEKMLLSG